MGTESTSHLFYHCQGVGLCGENDVSHLLLEEARGMQDKGDVFPKLPPEALRRGTKRSTFLVGRENF